MNHFQVLAAIWTTASRASLKWRQKNFPPPNKQKLSGTRANPLYLCLLFEGKLYARVLPTRCSNYPLGALTRSRDFSFPPAEKPRRRAAWVTLFSVKLGQKTLDDKKKFDFNSGNWRADGETRFSSQRCSLGCGNFFFFPLSTIRMRRHGNRRIQWRRWKMCGWWLGSGVRLSHAAIVLEADRYIGWRYRNKCRRVVESINKMLAMDTVRIWFYVTLLGRFL